MTELLPCPFCGGEAKMLYVRDICQEFPDNYWARCDNCHMSGKMFNTEAEAIAAWNTRSAGTCENTNKDGYGYRFDCSYCGYSVIVHNCKVRADELPNYCPNCGRKVTA